MESIEKTIAQRVSELGGRAYYVGGYVRDRLLSIDNKDVDIEVHGLDPEVLYGLLEQFGTPLTYGKSFGIYSLKGYSIDIALPRKERNTGKGHRDFEVDVDPYLGVKEAARRRDFTVNALMEDILTGDIIDSFGGLQDLEKKILRHTDEKSFAEDPLRVFRGCQFASRFGFSIAKETIQLCKTIDTSSLSKERVEEELKKALLKGKRPSVFFESLRRMDQLSPWFTEVRDLIGVRQDPLFHPEGDVYVHTMEVIDRCSLYLREVDHPYEFMLLGLCHDFGKTVTTEVIKGRIHSYEHEAKGLPIVKNFLNRIVSKKDSIDYCLNMTEYHMRPNLLIYDRSSLKASNKAFDLCTDPKDLVYFSLCDNPNANKEELFRRLSVFEEVMSRPYVTGKDLILEGFEPGIEFNEALSYAHKLRLAGIEKENALRQTISCLQKMKEKG